ncbi:MAG: thioredoxin family protein [Candidatus Omnitrophica bacterium]|nr:thioredoxin family protein [Candidatus Omnitrophota bacterium]
MELTPIALIGIFLSGLALNLTPCVYPMLSVTVALFGGRGEKPLSTAFRRALLYVAGIALMYSVLGLFAALTGGLFGAVLQNRWVLLGVAFLMFALALSMFGLYEFQVPSFLLNWMGGKRKSGNIGIFLSGACVGVFAAPCIGPPIVALLTLVGRSTNPWLGFLVFFVLALGLGLPYLVLGTFSGLLSKLPKSGAWLLWTKKVFGIVLLGLSFFYLALSLYADLLALVIPITLVGGGIYLGFLDRTGNEAFFFRKIKQLLGGFAVIAALLLVGGTPRKGVVWEPYTPEKITSAKQSGKPVIIDFFADWCLPCHELERYTYTNEGVIRALESFTRLKVDATDPTTPEALEPIERFEVLGVPTVLFLDPKGGEVPGSRITGYVPPKKFLRNLEIVQGTFKNEKNAAQ